MIPQNIRGRGAHKDFQNRFLEERVVYRPDESTGQVPNPSTQFITDHSKSILTKNNSPDVSFNYSLNPYRGCEHGCVYCYARPTHEYLGYSSGLDFESKIMVKREAPNLLRKELAASNWKPQTVAMSGITDCYQPVEKKLKLTRKCLEVFLNFRNPVAIITKNHLVNRDRDILKEMAFYNGCKVFVSITTLDKSLASSMEPRTSRPHRRLDTINSLAEAGIHVGVMIAPVIPGLNDHEIGSILKTAKAHGAKSAGYVILRLPYSVKDLFKEWINKQRPNVAIKVLNRIKSIREGNLNSTTFGERMRGKGAFAQQIKQQFHIECKKQKMNTVKEPLSTEHFRNPDKGGDLQYNLF